MKRMICEMCGSADLIKQDGVLVCQHCGTRNSVEEARKMMTDGPVDVSGSTVKIDNTNKLANLYEVARRAKNDENYFMETPKNGKKRTILPAPIVLDTLRKELQKQQTEKVIAGKLWDNHFNLVFTDALGSQLCI